MKKIFPFLIMLLVCSSLAFATDYSQDANCAFYYKFDTATVSTSTNQANQCDSSTINLTNNGATTGTASLAGYGEAWTFSGSSQYGQTSSNSPLTGEFDFCLGAWFNSSSYTIHEPLIGIGDYTTGAGMAYMAKDNQGVGSVDSLEAQFFGEDDRFDLPTSPYNGTWQWAGFCYQASDNNVSMYFNGVQTASGLKATDLNILARPFMVGARDDLSDYYTGVLDEVFLINQFLTGPEMQQVYECGFDDTHCAGSLSWEDPTPADGDHNNDFSGVTINASCTLSAGVSLWWNGSLIINNETSPASFTLNSSLVPSDGTYSYWGACDFGDNTTARTWIYDTLLPNITLNPNNGFNQSNQTSTPFAPNLQLNFTIADETALYGLLVNITHPNGTSFFSYTNETLSGKNFSYENLLDVSTWPGANYSVEITASDSHTAQEIPEYRVTKPIGGGRLIFDTAEGNVIRIETDLLTTVDAIKSRDRYSFSFDFLTSGTRSRTFQVKSDNAPIVYLPNSPYKAHFVIGTAKGGNWIDFEGLPGTPTITKISDYHYQVTFASVPERVTFNSIGGLNTNTQNYRFSRNTLSLDSATITPSTPITLDDLQGFASVTSGQNDTINYSWIWYANDTFYSSGSTIGLQGSVNLNNISSSSTSLGSNWTFSVQASAAGNSTAWINSTTVVVVAQNINVTIYDEETLSLLTQNVTILISSDSYERTVYTATGTIGIGDLQDGEHSLTFSATNYSTRTYIMTLTNASQDLIAYLAPDASDLTLTVKDQTNGAFIESALSTQYRIINNSWVPVESKYTDITGRIVFSYLANVKYRFIIAKSGYETNTFELNPVVFSSYDVYLTPTSTVNATLDYDRLVILYSPQIYAEGNNSFLWVISSPFGELTNYGYTLTYPGGSTSNSGSNSQGSSLTDVINITGATFADKVKMDMYYTSTVGGYKNFTLYFPIIINSSTGTFEANRDNHYGLGLIERILIMIFSVIFVVGIATLVGRPLEGLGLGILVMGWYVYIGFINFWAVAISVIVGLIIISARSSD